MNGAELLVKILKDKNIDKVFGYPGGAIMPVYDALYDSGITHYLARHEQGAAFSAMGYAKISEQAAVCLATSGPGATNLITSLADAHFDSVPLVVITGQVSSQMMGTDAFQEIDILGLSLGVTKHSFLIEKSEDIQPLLMKAFEIANEGRPGPVLIDFPKDMQLAEIEYRTELVDVSEKTIKEPFPKSHKNEFSAAIKLIKQAKQPMFYLGGGISIAKAETEVNTLLELLEFPSVSTLKGLGTVHQDNPLYLGMLGMHGNKAANSCVQEADLLIVIGARFDDRVTGKLSGFAVNAKVIHFDIDKAEINKLRQADVSFNGELKPILQSLSNELSKYKRPDTDNWKRQVLLRKNEVFYTSEQASSLINVEGLFQFLSKQLEGKTVITTDVGQHQMWAAQHIQFTQNKKLLTSGGLGTMGFGIPAAIGAKLADPELDVIVISGDGSFMMNVQELATIKRYQLPIKILLIDNNKLGMVKQWQELFFEKRYSETDLSDNPDFKQLANSFDIEAESIYLAGQIPEALNRFLNTQKSFLLHVQISQQDNVWPLVPPGATNEQMMEKTNESSL